MSQFFNMVYKTKNVHEIISLTLQDVGGVTSPDPASREIYVQMMDKGEFTPDTSYIQVTVNY